MSGSKDIKEKIRVYVRQRPSLNDGAQSADIVKPGNKISGITEITEKSCTYHSGTNNVTQNFVLDRLFHSSSTQEEMYESIAKPIVESALQGYSGTILAYGPTSSGKTFTMRGPDSSNSEQKGIMPRCIEQLLESSSEIGEDCELWASYLQIYCENVTDLLQESKAHPPETMKSSEDLSLETGLNQLNPLKYNTNMYTNLAIRERAEDGRVFVEGLNRYRINNVSDLWEILQRGDLNRSTASTNLNETSSRSHAVLMINVIMRQSGENKGLKDAPLTARESTLLLVDLAGSERASASAGRQYMRLEEAKAINLSLSALGNCMTSLAEGKTHIPYRDSKLTRLLQGCLGGNSRTAVIVNIPPSPDPTGEILNALRFASRASKVKVTAKISKYLDYEALYKEACNNIKELAKLKTDRVEVQVMNNGKVQDLEAQLMEKENQLMNQNLEIESLKRQLEISKQLQNPSIERYNNIKKDLNEENSGNKEINELKDQVEQIKKLELITKKFQDLQKKDKETINKLLNEQISLSDSLSNEREKHLETLQSFRKIQENYLSKEKEFQKRIDELLEEKIELQSLFDSLKEQTENSTSLDQNSREEIKRLKNEMLNMVSKEKVKEMEGLFLDTVTKLSNRVMMLEQPHLQVKSHENSAVNPRKPSEPVKPTGTRLEPGGRIRPNIGSNINGNNGNINMGLNITSSYNNIHRSRSSHVVGDRKPSK